VINKKLSQFSFPKAAEIDDIKDLIWNSQISDQSADLEKELERWRGEVEVDAECLAEI
jgi:hypothetical protein